MNQRKTAFTLIELIIVVVIIGILALIAIPRYFANVDKAQKNTVYANMDAIRQALLSYYAVYGVYPSDNTWPITVTIDGDTVVSVANPGNSKWSYAYGAATYGGVCGGFVFANKLPGNSCWYGATPSVMGCSAQTCTP
ncbi:MAG: prepilin-type N-terminal cleavage/methylation domain-containing protein [Candidatus Omnitrophota bacterium]|jgi:prepilin-type N-terminal cleavage/methylation domain-containing protein|nr:prepilin-type N-terminal cleavage/methylation domain-containing protein [Candidatus Omnitrophota bacterium]